jgi:hypothetical protein
MARCAFAKRVEAIIFMDCIVDVTLEFTPNSRATGGPNLGDLLNVSDRLGAK